MDFGQIRNQSALQIGSLGQVFNPDLPLLDDGIIPRNQTEIENRTLTLNVILACSFGFDRAQARLWLEREGLYCTLDPGEIDFMEGNNTRTSTYQNQIESINALAWCLSIVGRLNSMEPCDDNLVMQFPDLRSMSTAGEFRKNAKLRSHFEIVSKCDLLYCVHWAIKHSKIECIDLPTIIEPILVIKRRRAIEWVLNNDDWESIILDT